MATATTTTTASSEASGARAGFWRRFAGALIDGVILTIIGIFVRAAFKGGAGSGVSAAVSLLYFTLFIGSNRGQTPGMMALGIRVISLDGGEAIGYGRAFVRWIGGVLSAIPLFLGYFWMLWDKENQCWHDKLAADVVGRFPLIPSSASAYVARRGRSEARARRGTPSARPQALHFERRRSTFLITADTGL